MILYQLPHDERQVNKRLKNVNPEYDQYCKENAGVPSGGGAETDQAENDKSTLQDITFYIERRVLSHSMLAFQIELSPVLIRDVVGAGMKRLPGDPAHIRKRRDQRIRSFRGLQGGEALGLDKTLALLRRAA